MTSSPELLKGPDSQSKPASQMEGIETPKPVLLTSTRNKDYPGTGYSQAITQAQPDDKGLWYREVHQILHPQARELIVNNIRKAIENGNDNEIRKTIKQTFGYLWEQMGTGLSQQDIKEIADSLDSFESPYIVPLEKVDEEKGIYLINETTGPTNAFKDLALQMLTTMVSKTIEMQNKQAVEKAKEGEKGQKLRFVITQTSTSGDTGPAGGSGIQGKNFIINVIGFPAFEATFGQAGQMLGLDQNVLSVPMKQAFTAIQNSMKDGNTPEFREEMKKIIETELADLIEKYGFEIEVSAGSFNSVNIGRIDGQSIYHSVAILLGEAMGISKTGEYNEVLATGNFGHTYGNIQAKEMLGTGIGRIIPSMNENDAIYRLIKFGKYKKADAEISCPSVSMIIRYGSNVERFMTYFFGEERTKELIDKFNTGEEIILTQEEKNKIDNHGVLAYKVSIEDELMTIRNVFLNNGRLICPHTANAYFTAEQYKRDFPEDQNPMLVSETASPWKFLASTAVALSFDTKEDMRAKYEEYRQMELSQDGVKKLLSIIKAGYEKAGRKFDENIIPENLRKIYLDGFDMPEVVDASQFQSITVDFLKKYVGQFRKQVENLF